MADNDIPPKSSDEGDTLAYKDISSKDSDKQDKLSQLSSSIIGKRLGEYEVKREIGRGGLSVVYEAYQPSLKRNVALKVLSTPFISDPSFIERFHHEAEAAANLHHPNIVPIYGMGKKEDIYYFAMEEIEGKTLDDILENKEGLSKDRAAEIIIEVAKALDYAHSHEVVHRDIKPSNIMIDKIGRILVTDFGLAKSKRWEKVTSDKTILGTPVYMSPEQAQGEETDARTDIYSLGVVFYQMLTGRAPFEADEPIAILRKVIEEDPQEPRKIDNKIPKDLETITLKALEKDSDKRYQTAQEFIDDINRYREGLPIKAKPTGIIGHAVKKIRKYKMLSAAVAIIIVLLLGWSGYFVFQKSLELAKWQLVFEDNFEREILGKNWRFVDFLESEPESFWQIEDGRLRVIKPGSNTYAMLPGSFPGNIRLEFDARVGPDSPANCIEVILAGNSSKKVNPWGLMAGYSFQFSSWGGISTAILRNDVSISETSRINPKRNKTYHLRCERMGNKIRMVIDKETILEYMDLLPLSGAPYSEIGLGTNDSRIYYDNVKVWTQPLAQKTSPLSVADKMMENGYYQEAIIEYEQLVKAYPKTKIGEEALIKIAAALEADGKFDKAVEKYKEFVRLQPKSKWICYAKERITLCLQKSGKHEEAIRLARELRTKYPFTPILRVLGGTYNTKALEFQEQGLYEQAASYFNYQIMCVKDFEEYRVVFPWVQDRLGDLYRDIGEYKKAINAYNVTLTEYKDQREACAWARLHLGDVYRDMGNHEEAIGAYTLTLSEYKDQIWPCAWAQKGLGHVYRDMGKYEEAIRAYMLTLSEYKGQREPCARAQLHLGDVYRDMGNYEKAIAAWRKTIEEYPAIEQGRLALIAKLMLGEISIQEFQVFFDRSPKWSKNDALYYIATKLEMDGEIEKANEYYLKCIEVTEGKDWPYRLAVQALERLKAKQ